MSKFFPNEQPGYTPQGSVLIATVFDPLKTAIIKGILESEDIPYMIRERGAGASLGIIMGSSYLGTDIYVPESCYERGMELLAPLFEDEDEEGDVSELEAMDGEDSSEFYEESEDDMDGENV